MPTYKYKGIVGGHHAAEDENGTLIEVGGDLLPLEIGFELKLGINCMQYSVFDKERNARVIILNDFMGEDDGSE